MSTQTVMFNRLRVQDPMTDAIVCRRFRGQNDQCLPHEPGYRAPSVTTTHPKAHLDVIRDHVTLLNVQEVDERIEALGRVCVGRRDGQVHPAQSALVHPHGRRHIVVTPESENCTAGMIINSFLRNKTVTTVSSNDGVRMPERDTILP